MAEQQPTPLVQAIDRLEFETMYVRDVIHIAGTNPVCRLSANSLKALYEGLSTVLVLLRQVQSTQVPTAPSMPPTNPSQ